KALITMAVAHEHHLAGAQLGQAIAPQRLHVDEDVLRALAAREEAKALGAVEPLHQRALEPAFRYHGDMRALHRLLGRMHCAGIVHRDDLERLEAAFTLSDEADDAGTFEGGLKTVLAEASDVQENVTDGCVIGDDEPVTFGDVEPLDVAGNLDEIHIAGFVRDIVAGRVSPLKRGPIPHTDVPLVRSVY